MMRGRKRWCILLASLILLTSLSACDSEQSSVRVLDNTDAQPEYLSFFSYTSMSSSDLSKYWSERFMERYNKQVYIEFSGANYYAEDGLSYRELLAKRLESSAPDDLYIINAEDVMEFEKKGYWMDLSGMDFVDNLSDAALYQSTYNGKVFSVPLSFTGFGFAWNVDLLKAHNLTVPQNREAFLQVCETLKNAGIVPYASNKGYGLTVPAMCAGLSPLYANTDRETEIAALNSGEAAISDYLRDGFDFLSMMIDKGYMDPRQALDALPNEQDVESFVAGECAFICIGQSYFNDLVGGPFEIVLTGLPILEDGSVAVYGADSRLCVNPQSRNLDTALEFIEMVGTPEALQESAEWDCALSSAKGGGMTGLPAGKPLADLVQQPGQIPNQDFSLHFNTWESIRDVSRELCKGVSVDEACALLDEKQRADLQAYGTNTG